MHMAGHVCTDSQSETNSRYFLCVKFVYTTDMLHCNVMMMVYCEFVD